MKNSKIRRGTMMTAAAAALTMLLAACGGGDGADDTAAPEEAGETTEAAPAEAVTFGCEAYAEYGSFEGATVEILSSIRDVEADQLDQSWAEFEECTGIDVIHNGIGEFEEQIVVQAEAGNAPDLAVFPQPGLLARMVDEGYVLPATDEVEAKVDEGWTEDWKAYGTVDGEFYAAPLMSSVKSFIWYSPSMFADGGYEIPETLDEMMALTEQIAADTADDGVVKPWCAGIESGGATGWPATDWVEDMVLRTGGAEVYGQWVANEIPFNDPQIVAAIDGVGEYLLNEEFVNGGIGDVRSIATTSFNDGGQPILDGNCYMYRMASFFEAQWPAGTNVAEDGDAFAFVMPGQEAGPAPLLTGGEFVGAMNEREEVRAVQSFLASPEWANSRVSIGGVSSANLGVDLDNAGSAILRLAMELLQDESRTVVFDGSDMMPSEVGSGEFWTQMTAWIDGTVDSQGAADAIQAAWPTD
ncbi:MAG TPA: ABC transporter substrate-binding protein [Actinomycetaceae bacterium]|nr:ABC transporter substrate-binding protein [Actinomycetaceae bacterium]